jgi:hypothetical protein
MSNATSPISRPPVPPKWLSFIARPLARFFSYGVLWLVYAIALSYNMRLFTSLKEDTTSITNTAFVIAATVSALFFTWCQALTTDDPHRPSVLYAGERLLEASLALLLASLLKYAGRAIDPVHDFALLPLFGSFIRESLGMIAACFFASALLTSFFGLRLALPLLAIRSRPEIDFS